MPGAPHCLSTPITSNACTSSYPAPLPTYLPPRVSHPGPRVASACSDRAPSAHPPSHPLPSHARIPPRTPPQTDAPLTLAPLSSLCLSLLQHRLAPVLHPSPSATRLPDSSAARAPGTALQLPRVSTPVNTSAPCLPPFPPTPLLLVHSAVPACDIDTSTGQAAVRNWEGMMSAGGEVRRHEAEGGEDGSGASREQAKTQTWQSVKGGRVRALWESSSASLQRGSASAAHPHTL